MNGALDMETGAIKWFNPAKGYGFITKEDGTEVFVHYTGLAKGEDRCFFPGERVHFDQVAGERGPKAAGVHRIPTEACASPDSVIPPPADADRASRRSKAVRHPEVIPPPPGAPPLPDDTPEE